MGMRKHCPRDKAADSVAVMNTVHKIADAPFPAQQDVRAYREANRAVNVIQAD